MKVTFETSKPDGTHGLSESELFYLLLSERSWGTFGAGVTAHLTSQTSSQLGTIAPGPAVGAVVKHGKWKYALFNQNFLSDTFAETELAAHSWLYLQHQVERRNRRCSIHVRLEERPRHVNAAKRAGEPDRVDQQPKHSVFFPSPVQREKCIRLG